MQFGRIRIVAATMVALFAGVGPAQAQVGAVGAVPSGAVSGSAGTEQAPVFGESALTMPRGAWSINALGGLTHGSIGAVFTEIDYSVTQVLVAGFFGLTDRFMLGAMVAPYNRISIEIEDGEGDETGMGDVRLYGKYKLWSSLEERTNVAVSANVSLPTGDDSFGNEGSVINLRGAISTRSRLVSLHANAGVGIPTNDDDGVTTLFFGGGLVYSATERVSVGAEFMGSSASDAGERLTILDFAPIVRVKASPVAYFDAGVVINASTSFDIDIYDYAFVLGLTIGR